MCRNSNQRNSYQGEGDCGDHFQGDNKGCGKKVDREREEVLITYNI